MPFAEPLEPRRLLSATFYVSTSGSDANPGTSSLPWRHIQKAFNAATPGSTVLVAAGTYHERPTLHVSGNASAGFISFKASGHAIIDAANFGGLNTIMLADGERRDYVRIEGFEI